MDVEKHKPTREAIKEHFYGNTKTAFLPPIKCPQCDVAVVLQTLDNIYADPLPSSEDRQKSTPVNPAVEYVCPKCLIVVRSAAEDSMSIKEYLDDAYPYPKRCSCWKPEYGNYDVKEDLEWGEEHDPDRGFRLWARCKRCEHTRYYYRRTGSWTELHHGKIVPRKKQNI